MAKPLIQMEAQPPEPWPEMPIESSWIRQGNPVAHGIVITQSNDQKVSSGFWSCTPGEFDWHFEGDEFVHLLEGEVTVTAKTGEAYRLQSGDIAYFASGADTTWHVVATVKKFFVIRTL